MAKKIKLPLDMGNDVKVRTIEELKEHYNAEKVVSYFLDGQLLTWLEERFYEDEAGKIKGISKDSPNISAEIAKAFEIEIQDEVDVEEIEERNERLNLLRQFTSDDEILKNVDLVAFSQEDMDIVHMSDIIYLCGDSFRIPYSVEGKTYIGVNSPSVDIKSNDKIDLQSKNITVKNCVFSEATLANIKSEEPAVEKSSSSELSKKFGALESEIISSNIEVKKGKTLRFENKEIYVRADIECSGKIEFENCVIHYNEKEDCGIKMQGSGKACVYIKNCKFIGYGYKCAFISFNDPDKCIISVEDTEFTDCCCFIVDYDGAFEDGEISFSKCCFKNCLSIVYLGSSTGNFEMKDCIVIQDDIPEYYKQSSTKSTKKILELMIFKSPYEYNQEVKMFTVSSDDISSHINNSAILFTENYKSKAENMKFDSFSGLELTIFYIDKGEFSNCSFRGVSGEEAMLEGVSEISYSCFSDCSCICVSEYLTSVNNCRFENCSKVLYLDGVNFVDVVESQFINCREYIIDGYPTNVNIEDCEFINLSFEYDDCFNLGMDSIIRESIFNGVICNNHSLIYGNSDDCKSKDSIVKIHNCEFKNCSTEDGDGIIDGFINIPNIESSIQDCEGLENLDKEGDTAEDYTIRYEDENGDRIGCDMDIDSIMAEFA